MEQVSAFAAYKSTAPKTVTNNKTKKSKKQNKTNGKHVAQLTSKQPKKRKLTENLVISSPTTKNESKKPIVPESNGTIPNSKVNKKATNQPAVKSIKLQQNGSASSSNSNELHSSSVINGQEAFTYLLSGIDTKKFMEKNWEKSPLYVKRENPNHYDNLHVSTKAIDEMLRNNSIEFTKNLDVTSYENGIRETHNPEGRAMPGTVWEFYQTGCSIRFINPQTFIGPLHKFNATLQEYFHCLVGANIYLTPPNSQGFAPHYDDIEAFVLQIEGKKEWSLYAPRSENEKLPRESSGNFQQDEIGEPIFTQILEPGDLLYFPRGWIHQAKTVQNCHSLHITLSAYQKTSYAELFEELTKQAVKDAIASDVSFRRGLPLDIWNQFGDVHSHLKENPRRASIKNILTNLFQKLQNHLDIDATVDKLAIKYQHDALPPVLSGAEKARTTYGTEPAIQSDGEVVMPEMDTETEVRLLRAHIVRLANVDGAHHLYYHADNSKEYHGNELNFIEVEEGTIDVIKKLIQLYPRYVKVKNLSKDAEEAMGIVYTLWDRGLVMTKQPIE